MAKPKHSRNSSPETELYDLYDELDRLEELLEDMAELGVSSFAEAEERMTFLNEKIDALEVELESP